MIIRTATTTITTTTEHARYAIGSRRLALAVLSVAVTLGASASVRAEVSIHGDKAGVQVEASKASLSEVLSALESAFPIRHRTSVPLDQSISGTYRGSVRHVLSRLLGGFNYYIADTGQGGIEITVVGRPGAAAMAAAPQVTTTFQKLVVPPPTAAEVRAERQKAHHRRPP